VQFKPPGQRYPDGEAMPDCLGGQAVFSLPSESQTLQVSRSKGDYQVVAGNLGIIICWPQKEVSELGIHNFSFLGVIKNMPCSGMQAQVHSSRSLLDPTEKSKP